MWLQINEIMANENNKKQYFCARSGCVKRFDLMRLVKPMHIENAPQSSPINDVKIGYQGTKRNRR